tara:strand:+ start:1210 stop:1584 length:375 start_codon:yes stop_codon:yes gene_type:complete
MTIKETNNSAIYLAALMLAGALTYIGYITISRRMLLGWYAQKKPTIKQSALQVKIKWPNKRLAARKEAYEKQLKGYYWSGVKGVGAGWYNTRNNGAVKFDDPAGALAAGLKTVAYETKEMPKLI